MRSPAIIVGVAIVALGTATVLIGGVPDHPFYGTQPQMGFFLDEEADEWGEDAVMADDEEPVDRLWYALLGIVLIIGGAMIVESRRDGGGR